MEIAMNFIFVALGGDVIGMWSKRKSHASISNLDWNKDLSPWESPSLYKKEESFSGGADAYLLLLTEKIIPAICDLLGTKPWAKNAK